ncbi:MAG: SigE family RNA polymerase sigma factor [Candidatus Nanopelagicales bacterium]
MAPEFTEFVAARTPALLRTAYLLTGDWAAGEDLLQTTLEQCWRRWGRLGEHPEPYVRQAMLRTFLSWRRRRWTGETPTEELPEVAVDDATSAYDEREQLWRALQRLPRRQRAVIVLRYFDDLSEQETAAALGVAVGTVKSQASKALAALRVDESLVLGMDGVS